MTNEYRSLKGHVYDYIVDLIDGGALADDHKISEQQICEALGVSRTPVREALIQLASDGYLENVPRKGFYVKSVTEDSAREIVEVIGPLDGRAALLAVDRMTDEDLAQLQFLHGSMELAIEKRLYKKYDDLQRDFHACYMEKCGNARLVELIRQLNRCFMKREYARVAESDLDGLLRQANDEHAEIVRLFESRDGAGLQRYIRDVHWSDDNAKFLVWQ
ncbi:GntR family transcriptional regulator [Paraeggerthella hongkongensis]|jgi:DNA-binding GntR family transcriptional regulator|uniref:GntR family transcriptional regulator n=1 Tax=Paraeggerthella sp. TaxID=2897350 RepID=UPI000DF825DC|nr:GntR family transcriptional regulator [Paraeggerthella hongkongensis]